jgi:hypothetical protein
MSVSHDIGREGSPEKRRENAEWVNQGPGKDASDAPAEPRQDEDE